MTNPKILVTGTSSGLGRYLIREFNGIPFHRNDPNEIKHHLGGYDCIIHCAVDARNRIPANELFSYYQSNIKLTEILTSIPHGLFVYISSPGVYPDPWKMNKETDIPDLPEISSQAHHTNYLYGLFKLLAEKIVMEHTKNYIILRPTHIVGPTSRKESNLIRVLCNDQSQLTLSAESTYSFISMEQFKNFIWLTFDKNITGIFNAGSTQYVSLGEIASAVGSRPNFGNFVHNVHRMDTTKIRSVSPDFNKSTIEIAIEASRKFRLIDNDL